VATAPGLSELAASLAEAGRRRFVSWDDATWSALCRGPARALEAGLRERGFPDTAVASLLRSYLELGAEGVGQGYLHDAASGPLGFLGHAWHEGLPETLPRLSPDQASLLLADCWNLGENLENAPIWARRIFTRALADRRGQGLKDLHGSSRLVPQVYGGSRQRTAGRIGQSTGDLSRVEVRGRQHQGRDPQHRPHTAHHLPFRLQGMPGLRSGTRARRPQL
jgi:hypothetical protein